jgi:hypothetical protein
VTGLPARLKQALAQVALARAPQAVTLSILQQQTPTHLCCRFYLRKGVVGLLEYKQLQHFTLYHLRLLSTNLSARQFLRYPTLGTFLLDHPVRWMTRPSSTS